MSRYTRSCHIYSLSLSLSSESDLYCMDVTCIIRCCVISWRLWRKLKKKIQSNWGTQTLVIKSMSLQAAEGLIQQSTCFLCEWVQQQQREREREDAGDKMKLVLEPNGGGWVDCRGQRRRQMNALFAVYFINWVGNTNSLSSPTFVLLIWTNKILEVYGSIRQIFSSVIL